MSKVFLIPGLGADERIFQYIDLQGHDAVNVHWLEPNQEDTLASYAEKLVITYSIPAHSIVIGNSLGGMLAIEIAKKVELDKVILISSIKTADESAFKGYRYFPLYKLIPTSWLNRTGFLVKTVMGVMSKQHQQLFISMLNSTSPTFIKWAMDAISHWDNQTVPKNVYHITGDNDKIFSYKKIQGASIVKCGTHIMILNRANEINNWLKTIL